MGMTKRETSEKVLSPLEDLIAEIDREAVKDRVTSFDEKNDLVIPLKPDRLVRHKQYIRFFLEDILLAIPLSSALEISRRPDITPLPNLPDWILGVSNIRGEIISITDLKIFFGLPPRSYSESSDSPVMSGGLSPTLREQGDLALRSGLGNKRIVYADSGKMVIIVHNRDMKVGTVVDRVMGIFSPERMNKKIQSSPYKKGEAGDSGLGELVSYISGVIYPKEPDDKGNLLNILDIDKLLASPRMNAFRTE